MDRNKEPTARQVEQMRVKFGSYIEENGQDAFDPRDVEKLMSDDLLVKRYFKHFNGSKGDQVDSAVNMMVNSFKWRKETGIRDLREGDLKKELKDLGAMFFHNRDRDGKRLLVVDVKKHERGKYDMGDLKMGFHYSLERIDREENGDKLTIIFDCASCGLKNMDMELIRYIIKVFTLYTPNNLNYIIILEMPWVLNAVWRVIKSWLPEKDAALVKFVNNQTLDEFVSADQRLKAWGGEDDWEYVFESELDNDPPPSYNSSTKIKAPKQEEEEVVLRRSVQKSNSERRQRSSVEKEKNRFSGHGSVISRSVSFRSDVLENDRLLSLTPSEYEVIFTQNPQGELHAKVKVQNTSGKPVAFKIKTTSASKFRVRPGMSSLRPGGSITIEIQAQSSNFAKDKFLISALVVEKEGLNSHEIAKVMKIAKPESQFLLRCVLSTPTDLSSKEDLEREKKALDAMSKKVSSLMQTASGLKEQTAMLKKMLSGLLVVLSVLIIFVFWRTRIQDCMDFEMV